MVAVHLRGQERLLFGLHQDVLVLGAWLETGTQSLLTEVCLQRFGRQQEEASCIHGIRKQRKPPRCGLGQDAEGTAAPLGGRGCFSYDALL